MHRFAIPAAAAGLLIAGCVAGVLSRSSDFDSRSVTIQTLSLFNQRTPSSLGQASWKGDWLFRRDRLELVDRELRRVKPDLLLFQEAMARKGSASETDAGILLAGALTDYDWYEIPVQEYEDTGEVQSMAVAAGLPLRVLRDQAKSAREVWMLGSDGYLMAASVDLEWQPVSVFNVQMPSDPANSNLWYSFIQERILEHIRRGKHCSRRIVVAGYIPATADSQRFNDFMEQLQLKDASLGFCQVASRCYTATPNNDIYTSTSTDQGAFHADRVLVHRSASVYSSARNMDSGEAMNRYTKLYGISTLWPTQRFGWMVSVRFARCGEGEMF